MTDGERRAESRRTWKAIPRGFPNMMRYFPVVTATVLLLAAGIVHGYWTDRWLPAAETAEAARRLDGIPMTLGEWEGEDLDSKAPQPGVAGCVQRRYSNGKHTVVMFLVCGRPGPVSIHTPEACYGASGYAVAARKRIRVGEGEAWTADAIRVRAAEETRVRLYWGWNNGQGWTAADDPRWLFARQPVLHKLYVLRELGSFGEPTRDDPCETFLKVLLPELDKALFVRGS
jgi:hypothetical protein